MSEKYLNFLLHSDEKYKEAIKKYDRKFNEAIFDIIYIVNKILLIFFLILGVYNYITVDDVQTGFSMEKLLKAFKNNVIILIFQIVICIYMEKAKKKYKLKFYLIRLLPFVSTLIVIN